MACVVCLNETPRVARIRDSVIGLLKIEVAVESLIEAAGITVTELPPKFSSPKVT